MRYSQRFMAIKLESGNTVTTALTKGIDRGDKVEVDYDFTHSRVRTIRLSGTQKDAAPSEPINPMKQFKIVPDVEDPINEKQEAFSLPVSEGELECEEGGEEEGTFSRSFEEGIT